jgi:hypothetical protein
MPVYFFTLQTSNAHVKDADGAQLGDELAAWKYARHVARESMKRREPQSRPRRIDVRDGERRQGFEVLFANVDEIFATLGRELRSLIENIHRKQASLIGAITTVRLLLA